MASEHQSRRAPHTLPSSFSRAASGDPPFHGGLHQCRHPSLPLPRSPLQAEKHSVSHPVRETRRASPRIYSRSHCPGTRPATGAQLYLTALKSLPVPSGSLDHRWRRWREIHPMREVARPYGEGAEGSLQQSYALGTQNKTGRRVRHQTTRSERPTMSYHRLMFIRVRCHGDALELQRHWPHPDRGGRSHSPSSRTRIA